MLGKPVIRGTRIPVELILPTLSGGTSEGDLVNAYPRQTREDIRARSATRRTRSPMKKRGAATRAGDRTTSLNRATMNL
jgi:uncharacterized protein (DUF433 family)